MGFSFSSRSIKQRPSVQAMQTGGYRRAGGVPNANDPVENYGAYASVSPTHVGSMSASEYNASMGDRAREKSQAFRDQADAQGGLAKVTQGINSVRSGRNWDALAGALDMFGVEHLSTGAASGMDQGPGTYDAKTQMTTYGPKAGFFDTPSMSALQQQNKGYLDTQDTNRTLGQEQQGRQDEMQWELNARELDKKDAQRGVTNTWSGRKKGFF